MILMPQFDTFSFFSQLFWVLVGFSYLYLLLCFYLLPAFAVVLKVRARKLVAVDSTSSSDKLVVSTTSNSTYFDSLTVKLNDIFAVNVKGSSSINSLWYNDIIVKNEAFYKFNYSLLNNFKIINLFF